MLSQKQKWRRMCHRSRLDGHVGVGIGQSPSRLLPHGRSNSTSDISVASKHNHVHGQITGKHNGERGFRRDRRRSVSFDNAVRVVLVPTRQELQSVRQRDPVLHANGNDERREDENGEERECGDGIWWSLQECSEFRMSLRRQLLALGLETCPNLLSAAITEMLAVADDSDSDTELDKRVKTGSEEEIDRSAIDGENHGSCDAATEGGLSLDDSGDIPHVMTTRIGTAIDDEAEFPPAENAVGVKAADTRMPVMLAA